MQREMRDCRSRGGDDEDLDVFGDGRVRFSRCRVPSVRGSRVGANGATAQGTVWWLLGDTVDQ